jgi:Signal transduction histidine kinase
MDKRSSLNYTALALLLAVGVFGSYGLIMLLTDIGLISLKSLGNSFGEWYVATALAVGVSILAMVYVFILANRREKEAVHALDWLHHLQSILLELKYPVNAETLYPVGVHMASLFTNVADWVMFVEVPGLLIQGEVERRKHVRAQSRTEPDWPPAWAENWLHANLENESVNYSENHVILSAQLQGYSWVFRSKGGDLAIGLTVTVPGRGPATQPVFITNAINAGFDLILKRLSVMLIDTINRRGQLGAEGFGTLVRMMVHEVAGELQGVFNCVAQLPASNSGGTSTQMNMKEYRAVLAGLWRTSNWIQIMRDLPLIVDNFIPLTPVPTVLKDVLDEVVLDATRAWPNVQFMIRGMQKEWMVNADIHLRSVLRNVIFNAASYSPDEETVEIRLSDDGRYISMLVTDKGPGIDPSYAEKIFDPYTPSEVRPNGHKGAGVGLSVARAIARAYGGDIRVFPRNAGGQKAHGGKFEIRLPLLIEPR